MSPWSAPTTPSASTAVVKLRRAACHNVLRSQRQPCEPALERVHAPGEEEQVLAAHVLEASGAEERRELPPREELHVLVERAVADHAPRERVPRVVLEDGDEPAGPDDTRRLAEERQPGGV